MPNLIPVVRELPADLETPVSVYLKLAGHGPSFLLESDHRRRARGALLVHRRQPGHAYVCATARSRARIDGRAELVPIPAGQDPLHFLAHELRQFVPADARPAAFLRRAGRLPRL